MFHDIIEHDYFSLIQTFMNGKSLVSLLSTCKSFYTKMDDKFYYKSFEKDDDFLILREGKYDWNVIKTHKNILGLGNVELHHNRNWAMYDYKFNMKNIHIHLDEMLEYNHSSLYFQDCIFTSNVEFGQKLFIMNKSECAFTFCYFSDIFCPLFFMTNSMLELNNTIFSNIYKPIRMIKSKAKVYDCKFLNCLNPILCIEQFRLVVRYSKFINCSGLAISTITECNRNHIEIDSCEFESIRKPRSFILLPLPKCAIIDIDNNYYDSCVQKPITYDSGNKIAEIIELI